MPQVCNLGCAAECNTDLLQSRKQWLYVYLQSSYISFCCSILFRILYPPFGQWADAFDKSALTSYHMRNERAFIWHHILKPISTV